MIVVVKWVARTRDRINAIDIVNITITVIVAAVAYLGNTTSSQFNHMGGCLNTPRATC